MSPEDPAADRTAGMRRAIHAAIASKTPAHVGGGASASASCRNHSVAPPIATPIAALAARDRQDVDRSRTAGTSRCSISRDMRVLSARTASCRRPRAIQPPRTCRRLVVAWCLIILRSAVYIVYEHSYFDSDQALPGLMAKHLVEGRAFPLFLYGPDVHAGGGRLGGGAVRVDRRSDGRRAARRRSCSRTW